MAEVNIKLKLPSFKDKGFNIILALITGFFEGMVLWGILQIEAARGFYDFLATFVSLYIALSVFTLIAYRKVSNIPLYVGTHAVYALFVLWTMLLTHTPDMKDFLYLAYPVASLLFFSISFMALSNKKLNAVYRHYIHFIEEFNKVFTLSLILNIFLGVVLLLFISLLDNTFGEGNGIEELYQFIMLATLTPIPFVVLALTYDFKKPIDEQTELRILNLIVSLILTGSTFIIAFFIGFYLLALSVSSFDPILETGDTSSTFLALIASCISLLYLSSQFVGRSMSRVVNIVLVGLHNILMLECFVMLCVAIYALGVRIDAYGVTFQRMIGVMAMIAIALIMIQYALILFSSLVPRMSIGRYAAGLRFTIFTSLLIAFVFTILVPMMVDLESLSLRMNYNRVHGNNDLTVHLDRAMFDQSGNKSVNFLEDKYEKETDLKMKADSIITLQRIGGDLSFAQDDGASQNANNVLEDIADNEGNTYLKSLSELSMAKGNFGRTYNNIDECKELVAELLDKDPFKENKDLIKFCSPYQSSI